MLSSDEKSLLERPGFDSQTAELLKSASKQTLQPYNPTYELLAGIAVMVADGKAAEALIKIIQSPLIDVGYRAFWTDLRDESGMKLSFAVAVLHSTDHFAILEATKPHPENHTGPEVIWEKFKSFERICELEIVGAAADWVAVTFKTLPVDLRTFAEDIYLFCPDSCDLNSGIGSKGKITKQARALAKEFCPELSEHFRQQLKIRYGEGPVAAVLPEEFLGDIINDAEWSVRLLISELREKKYFFFWWD